MGLDIGTFFPGFRVSPLGEADLAAALALCQGNPLYYRYYGGRPTLDNLRQDLTALPPGKGLEDKYFLALWQGGKLTALLDLIDGYPEPDTAWIGWLILEQDCQGRGLGSRLVEELLEGLRGAGFARVKLAYIKGNPQSRRFWEKNGFSPLRPEEAVDAGAPVPMERLL